MTENTKCSGKTNSIWSHQTVNILLGEKKKKKGMSLYYKEEPHEYTACSSILLLQNSNSVFSYCVSQNLNLIISPFGKQS